MPHHRSPVAALLASYSWLAMRQHPWRHAAALAAVALGVALAYAVHLINASALSEFASAVRSVNGQPDISLRAARATGANAIALDERIYPQLAQSAQIRAASPVLETQVMAAEQGSVNMIPIKLTGVDALMAAPLTPGLMPRVAEGRDRLDLFAPHTVFLNTAARQMWTGTQLLLSLPNGEHVTAAIAGSIGASGPPMAVMDIGAMQDLLGLQGQLTRIDLRLAEGVTASAFEKSHPAPIGALWEQPGDSDLRASNISRAYRVNLTVLALVALFTGAFMVYSVLSLSVARRSQQLALLGVLGMTLRERMRLIVWESALLGIAGSALGLLLGALLAGLALWLLGGDLGGGYFSRDANPWQWPWNWPAAVIFGSLGVACALVGGWRPARLAATLPPAQALKGLGNATHHNRQGTWFSAGLIATGLVLCLLPPIGGLALGAYAAIALLLVGCITLLPPVIYVVNDRIAPFLSAHLLPMLAVERARHARETAAVAVSGVVAALALSVALTVMVASFRDSVANWLGTVLPAELYIRIDKDIAAQTFFTQQQVDAVKALPGIDRIAATQQTRMHLDAKHAPITLIARDFAPGASPEQRASATLPLVGAWQEPPSGAIAVYASETFAAIFNVKVGAPLPALAQALSLPQQDNSVFVVAGIWRDYARQQGSIALDRSDYMRLTGDTGVNDLALWFSPGQNGFDPTREAAIRQALSQAGLRLPSSEALEFSSVAQLRATSLRIFDRSFAVTYWLQAVAIAIGLFGVAASFSAQVLARRKEFGMLRHIGFTRRQILTVVAGEGTVWTAIGSVAGLVLGLGISLILVKIVNPQSFHWTMDLTLPAWRLALLCAAVIAVGAATAWLSARAAAGRDAVLAVKEDW